MSMSTIVSISMMLTKMILKILKIISNIMMMMMMPTITVVIIKRQCRCWMFPSQRCQTTDSDSSVRVQEGRTGGHFWRENYQDFLGHECLDQLYYTSSHLHRCPKLATLGLRGARVSRWLIGQLNLFAFGFLFVDNRQIQKT